MASYLQLSLQLATKMLLWYAYSDNINSLGCNTVIETFSSFQNLLNLERAYIGYIRRGVGTKLPNFVKIYGSFSGEIYSLGLLHVRRHR